VPCLGTDALTTAMEGGPAPCGVSSSADSAGVAAGGTDGAASGSSGCQVGGRATLRPIRIPLASHAWEAYHSVTHSDSTSPVEMPPRRAKKRRGDKKKKKRKSKQQTQPPAHPTNDLQHLQPCRPPGGSPPHHDSTTDAMLDNDVPLQPARGPRAAGGGPLQDHGAKPAENRKEGNIEAGHAPVECPGIDVEVESTAPSLLRRRRGSSMISVPSDVTSRRRVPEAAQQVHAAPLATGVPCLLQLGAENLWCACFVLVFLSI